MMQTSEPSSDAVFNSFDVMFAQMMVPHHEQAIEMADAMLEKDAIDPRVIDLDEQVKAAQQPEIDQLDEWLDEWGADPAPTGAMSRGSVMMSDTDVAAPDTATGAEASRVFLEQMTVHHEVAITMAQSEIDGGANPDAIELAQAIVDAQTEEITLMRDILDSL
ncbi:MAG TPA: DUF305 domain-containing protein [Actinomycetota bacterium]